MKVKWVSQENPTSAADALEKSIAKWRFFSYCAAEQAENHTSWHLCGLCLYDSDCHKCCLGRGTRCRDNPLIQTAYEAHNDFIEGEATLAEFHAAARKVFAKLRSLRKS